MMMQHQLPYLLIPLTLLVAAPAFATPEGTEPLSCADRSIVASAVRTTEDIQAFVQCAYEFVQEVGFDEARRAFHEDERWKSGPTYVFIAAADTTERLIVFPPDTSR